MTRNSNTLLDGTDLRSTNQERVMAYTPPFADRYGGSAVATRWPHRVVEVLDARLADAGDVPWCSLATLVEVPGTGELLFIAATAAWRPDAEAARERQAVAITDLDARHRTELPTIIAGDFYGSTMSSPDPGTLIPTPTGTCAPPGSRSISRPPGSGPAAPRTRCP